MRQVAYPVHGVHMRAARAARRVRSTQRGRGAPRRRRRRAQGHGCTNCGQQEEGLAFELQAFLSHQKGFTSARPPPRGSEQH
jgi:hypothetical protein